MAEYNTLPVIEEDVLEYSRLIGYGGFGTVYQATHKEWQQDVAVKKCSIRIELTESEKEAIFTEAKILSSANHDNVVRLYGVCVTPTYYGLVMEYMVHGALIDILREEDIHLPYPLRRKFLTETCAGMNFLHRMGATKIYHCDLKTANLLIDDHCTIKISDFGLSETQRVSQQKTVKNRGGTITHIPPENLTNIECPITEKFDVFSFGIVTWEVLSRKSPYEGALPNSALIAIAVGTGQRPSLERIPADAPKELCELMKQCWSQDPKDRPQFYDILPKLKKMVKESQRDMRMMVEDLKQELEQKRKGTTIGGRGGTEVRPVAPVPAVRKKQQSARVTEHGAMSRDRDGGKQPMARSDVDSMTQRFDEALTLPQKGFGKKGTIRVIKGEGIQGGSIRWPIGVFLRENMDSVVTEWEGRVLVLDYEFKCKRIIYFDSFEEKFNPFDVFVSKDGIFYIPDNNNKILVICNENSKIIDVIKLNHKPLSVCVSQGYMYTIDWQYVYRIDSESHDIIQSSQLTTGGVLESVCTNMTGNVMVSDFTGSCVHILDKDLNPITQLRHKLIKRPMAICTDDSDNLYVCDWRDGGKGAILQFGPNGDYITTIYNNVNGFCRGIKVTKDQIIWTESGNNRVMVMYR